jgi:insecticidal toxin
MLDAKIARRDDGYEKFVNLFKLADLEQALLPYKNTAQYDAIIRYYFACIGLLDSPRLLQPLALFRQALGDLSARRVRRETGKKTAASPDGETAPELSQIIGRVDRFQSRLQYSVEQMKVAATEVPKILHFVWLGGGIGDIQRDYLNIWRQVLAGQGYTINLWYDSDALLAYQSNRLIVEAAKADAMLQGGAASDSEWDLIEMYEARAIVLKQQMFAHINQAVLDGELADEARVQLLSRAYGQQADDLRALKQANLHSLESLQGEDLQLRDLASPAESLQLRAIYDQEMRLRGNLAAASDVVRLEAVDAEGGMYSDIDNLPPLLRELGGVDISGLHQDARLGILQLLLEHNRHWMPGREALRGKYTDHTGVIPEEHRAALEAFAKSAPALDQVFQAPADRLARPYMLRAVVEGGSLSNAYLMAHPGAAMTNSVLQRIRFNYQVLASVEREAAQRGIPRHGSEALLELTIQTLQRALGLSSDMSVEESDAIASMAEHLVNYYGDGLNPKNETTIHLTGPKAMRTAMADYEKAHFTPEGAEASQNEAGIPPLGTVNRATEEELDHSWKENLEHRRLWAEREWRLWHEGQFKTRYAGNIDELLKHSTVEFELGWPLIEGRHVVHTELLQRMAQTLGERFTDALQDGHDGPISFAEPLPLSFDDRQAIREQPGGAGTPVALSDEKTRFLPLDEVLIRLAKGTLQAFQLTPLQRLKLGGLLGAETLDDHSLLERRAQLDSLANSLGDRGTAARYVAIEQHLLRQRAPAFMAGLASDDEPLSAPGMSALELKKQALSETATLFEWGRQVAQIQHLATQEHREQVRDRVVQVLDQFAEGNVKLVPQDLLMQGPGDTAAGRCVPLALAMSAALARGEAATRQLRARFYLAVIEPEQADSVAFLSALEELRGVQLEESGQAMGRVDLDMAVGLLEGSPGPRTLMLNTDNHAMVVARTENGYHFYDPNFGLFEFSQPAVFSAALKQFFQVTGLARHYAAFGTPERPQFDLIDVHGERVAQLDLSTGFKVDLLFDDEALPQMPAQRIRQRLNSAHGKSLVANPQLGSSLLEIDSQWWAEQIALATSRLQEGHAAVTPLVPLFDSLELTAEGTYRLSLLDPKNAEHVVQVTSADSRLLRIRNYLSELFATLGRKRAASDVSAEPAEVGAVHTLNAAFAIQALFNALRGREGDDRTLTTAVQWHAYINYAQLLHGNAVDVAGLVGLVQAAIRDEKLIARTCGPVVGEALQPLAGSTVGVVAGHIATGGVGTLLGLANVGFDIYQLANATNDVEKAQYGTQLAFDSASVVLGSASLIASLTGAATTSVALGGASVIVGGLAIGAAALAQAFARIAEEAKAVGLFFDDLEQAHHGAGYRYDGGREAWLPRSALIIDGIDLAAGKLHLDSTRLYPLRDHFGVPEFEADYARAINLSQELGYPAEMDVTVDAGQTIVLPCTPQVCYRYEYQILPFASQRHDKGFDIARRLEKKKADGQWLFLFSFYSFPSHYVIHRMYPDYRPVDITVKLDDQHRMLTVPVLPKVWKGLVSYRIQGVGAECTLGLNPGVEVRLESSGLDRSQWMLLAPWASEDQVRFDQAGQFFVGDVKVALGGTGAHRLFVRFAGGAVFQVDYLAGHLLIAEAAAPDGLDGQVLQDHLQAVARDHRLLMRYTQVHNYLVPFEDPATPRYTSGWYDAHEDRMLYIRNSDAMGDDALLGAVSGGSAFFYDPESYDVFEVDATTGWLRHRYRLLVKAQVQSRIRSVEADAHGMVHVVQEFVHEDATVERCLYQIQDSQLWLTAIVCDHEPTFEQVFSKDVTLADWSPVLGKFFTLAPVHKADGSSTVDWQLAGYVSVSWKIDKQWRDMAWIRTRDNLIVRPVPRRHHARGWADSIQDQRDLTLLTIAEDSNLFVVYDRLRQQLCRVELTHAKGERSWTSRFVQPDRLKQVTAHGNGYLAITADGLFFNITAAGELRLGGLDAPWLAGRPQWWQALAAVAREYAVEHFAVVGVRDVEGAARISAWFVDNRLLLSAVGAGQEVRMLGLTPDNQAVWLFDVTRGEIWRQTFIDPQRLEQAFGDGAQLLVADLLPAAVREWAHWQFADVTADAAGLRATSTDGVLMTLHYQQPVRITGVNSQWVNVYSDDVRGHLRALLETEEHQAFISVDAGPESRQWYIADSARLIRIAATALPKQFDMLGTHAYTDVLLHEPAQGAVKTYPGERQVGALDYIKRHDDVLVVEGDLGKHDILPLIPDDVRTLVLRMGQGGMKCHLTPALGRRLDSVVVDCRYPLGEVPVVTSRLLWSPLQTQKIELGIVDEHLVLVDPDSEHCLICRDVCAADPALRGDVLLDVQGLGRWPVSHLVERLRQREDGTDSVRLVTLFDAADIQAAGA